MDLTDWLIVAAVLLCLVASFLFSGSETALTASSRAAMLRLARDGNPRAALVAELLASRERLLGALLIGNNVVNIAASSMATGLLLAWFGEVGVIYATLIMTVLVVVFCEVLPKTAAFDSPDRIALAVARPIATAVRLLGPVLWAVSTLVRWLLARTGIVIGESAPILTPHEALRGAVDLLHREGGVEKHDRDMLGGLLDLRELTVADVMIHRTDVIMANAADPPAAIIEAVLAGPKTRVPLWQGSPQNIVGVLHVKDVLRALHASDGDFSRIDVLGLARPAWFVPEIRPLSEQLKAFRRRKSHFALVVDEYGEMMGLVTLEDILEEIVGDIADEHDIDVPGVRLQPDGSVNVDGGVPIRDLNRAMDWNLPDGDATTIAGLVIHEARSIPEPGQSFTFHGFRFHVLRRERNRITALRIAPLSRRGALVRVG
ncbi:Hemolysin C [Rhodoplanes serenus]|uniref:Hemolysin C n=1 Tax=Rhodoplanes serenus TaxID=200615 RepID=A0A3S4BTT1_9BRAD|nr:HlyC/CorC family transporter [Rhodoplanes serenus]VCU07057.1 Hemolysin C [Rhodoplanes serenus]